MSAQVTPRQRLWKCETGFDWQDMRVLVGNSAVAVLLARGFRLRGMEIEPVTANIRILLRDCEPTPAAEKVVWDEGSDGLLTVFMQARICGCNVQWRAQ